MTSSPRSVVIVGVGLAGTRTVAALRAQGFTGRITVVGGEESLGYDRPPLSKELFSRTEPAWLQDELGIELRTLADEVVLGESAVALETIATEPSVPSAPADVNGEQPEVHRHVVRTDHGRELTADAVVLAVGSEPIRVRGWDSALVLRTADDAHALRTALGSARRFVVVGAGWIGAEVAGVAAARGVTTTVVEAAPAPLALALGRDVGARFVPWYAPAGIELRTGATVVSIGPDGVMLEGGEVLEADVVLSAVGARAATAWLRGTLPLGPRGSIPTDVAGRVDVPGAIYAVGDCASRDDPAWDRVPAGHWSAALHDPDLVAAALLGLQVPATHVPYVFSRQLGHDLGLVGLPEPDDEIIDRQQPDGAQVTGWSLAYVRRGRLHAVLSTDRPREIVAARRVLRDGPVPVDVAALAAGARLRDAVPHA